MKVEISDDDLKELIETGHNNKYKRYSKDKRFMEGLAKAYKIMLTVEKARGLIAYSFLHYERLRNNAELSSVRVETAGLRGFYSEKPKTELKLRLLN